MKAQEITAIVMAVLSGEVSRLAALEVIPHDDLEAAIGDRALVLTRDATANVIRGYAAGVITIGTAQRWAAFVGNGYLPAPETHRSGVRPLDIEYEGAYEEEIAEAVSRLDELGDLVDGEISPSEAAELLRTLADRG